MQSRTREARRVERGSTGKSILAGLSSLSAAVLQWGRKTPPDREPAEPGGDATQSILAGLSSLSAAVLQWGRKTPPDREPAEPGGGATQSVLAGLLSLSTAWWPWVRKTPRHGELKTVIMAALTHVDHYEDRGTRRRVDPDASGARSVGLSYREIQRRLQAEYPGRRVSIMTIRSYARDARREGRAMPYRRPNSMRRRKTAR